MSRPVNTRGLYEQGGNEYVSVTTVQGLLAKPALIPWAANEAVKYIAEKSDSYGANIYKHLPTILADARTAYKRKSDSALDVGSMLHNAIEVYLKDQKPYLENKQLRSMFTAWKREWADKYMVECIQPERPVYCDRYDGERFAGYAGTMDFYGKAKPKIGRKVGESALCVLDWKTSGAIYPEYLTQCMAYLKALDVNAEFVGVVRVDKNDYKVEYRCKRVEDLKHEYEGFLKLVDYWWLTKGAKLWNSK